MNKQRRKQLDVIIGAIRIIRDDLESIMNEEEEYRDNMPENLQGSEKYETADNACEALYEALDELDEAIISIEVAQGY